MRITSQMLSESAKKAGVSSAMPTLLDYINKDDSSNTLLSVMTKHKKNTSDLMQKTKYEDLNDSAEQLFELSKCFATEGEENIFAKAEKEGNNENIFNSIQKLINSFNNTLEAMKFDTGTLSEFYKKKLKEIPEEYQQLLEKIGISFSKAGKIQVDMDKLKTANMDDIRKLFGGDSDFTAKLAYVASKISENAEANLESFSSGYNSSGNAYTTATSKFDYLG